MYMQGVFFSSISWWFQKKYTDQRTNERMNHRSSQHTHTCEHQDTTSLNWFVRFFCVFRSLSLALNFQHKNFCTFLFIRWAWLKHIHCTVENSMISSATIRKSFTYSLLVYFLSIPFNFLLSLSFSISITQQTWWRNTNSRKKSICANGEMLL